MCNVLVLTLKGTTMTWFKGLEDWLHRFVENLVQRIHLALKARGHQIGFMDALNAIIQGKKEMLHEYMERFTKEALEV